MSTALTAPLREEARTPADALRQGAAVGRYVVVECVGRGSGGTVYAAYDAHLGRKVALKLVHRDGGDASAVDTRRFAAVVREARALARLDHPNVVTVHDVGDDGERAYIAMEFVEGIDLAGWMEGASSKPWRERLEPFLAAGAGLVAAHARRIVHGDFKPANVLRGDDGRVRVTDFGVAVCDEHTSPTDPPRDDGAVDGGTYTGELWGTPLYMAPELFDGGRPDTASDVYSFSASCFEALYGVAPAQGATLDELAAAKRRAPAVPEGPAVPRKIRELVLAGLEPNPRARPALRVLLRRLRSAARPRLRRVAPAAGILLVGLGGAAWAGAFADEACSGAARHLDGVWDGDARATVSAALQEHAVRSAATRVTEALDDYAVAWVDAHEHACTATQLGEQSSALLDHKMSCLRTRLSDLDALVAVLADADRSVATHAVAAVAELPALRTCDDPARLVDAVWSPPEDAAPAYAAYVGHISRARALQSAGQFPEGLAAAQAALGAAQELDATPLVDDARYQVGLALASHGDYEAAATTLSEAALTAAVNEHDETAARASIAIVRVLGSRLSRLSEASTWAKHAAASIERAGLPAKAAVTLRMYLGESYVGAGRLDEALIELDGARALAVEALGERDSLTASVLLAFANLEQARGRAEAALVYHRQAIPVFEEALGASHPTLGAALNDMGNALAETGRTDEAIATHERAIEILHAQGIEHPVYQVALNNLAAALADAGRPAEAVEAFERVVSVMERTLGPEHVNTAAVHVNIAGSLGRLERYAEAEAHAAKALPVLEARLGPAHPFVSFALTNIGAARLLRGHPEDAREPLARAVEIQRQAEVPPREHGEALFALARALGSTPKGRALASEARAAYVRAESTEDIERVDAWLAAE